MSRTEDASAAAGGCPQSVESAVLWAFEDAFNVAGAVLRAFEDASRTPGALFCAPSALENASRTTEACFAHRVPLMI